MIYAQLHSCNNGSELLFNAEQAVNTAVDDEENASSTNRKPWKVMIVDDDDVVHQVSLMVLSDYKFEGRPVEVIQAYSGDVCRKLMKEHPDTAVLLLDVIMETESAGLDTVKYVREVLNNHAVRIIIRTGQPGQLLGKDMINEYDINGYLEKSVLTAQNLFNSLNNGLAEFCNVTE